jgi:integrase
VDDRDRREPFTSQQLSTLFSSAPWDKRQPDDAKKPGQFWVPLIALYSGMRMGEIACLRIMDIERLEGVLAFRVRPHEGRALKTKESRRDLPVHSAILVMGFEAFVDHRRGRGQPDDLLFPDGKANSRGQGGAKLGEWFSRRLKELEIVGTKLGMHSFRHNFEDRLKAVGLHGRPEGQALGGRKVSGSEGSYGSEFPIGLLQDALEKVSYPGLDLLHCGS